MWGVILWGASVGCVDVAAPLPTCTEGRSRCVTQVALGARFGCAALRDTTVWCWGRNDESQLGYPTTDLCTEELELQDRVNFAKKLQNQLIHLEKMAGEMLQFVRARPHKTQIIALDELVNEALQTLEGLSQEKHIELSVSLKADNCMVSVERPSVVSAFIAILENAIQCSSPGQTIVVQTQADHLRGQLSIEDNGPGIAEDMLPRLFEPFATNRVTGTGLGLAIAQNAIRSHRGEITAQNKPEGGALFVVALPSMANF